MLKQWLKKDKEMIGRMIAAPFVATIIICFVTSGLYVENISLAIANLDDSSLSGEIVAAFENHSGFDVTLYVDSEEALQEAVYSKEATAGLILPAGFGKEVTEMKSPNALLILDGTNTTISGAAQGYASGIFKTLNAGIQTQALQKSGVPSQNIAQMMGNFTFVERNMYDPYSSFIYNMIYMVMAYMIQMQFLCFFLMPLLWEERENNRLTLGNKMMYKRIGLMCILTGCSTYAAMFLGSKLFHFPIASNFLCHLVIMLAYMFALCAVCFVISLFTCSRHKRYFFEIFCIAGPIILLTSGGVWPEFVTPNALTTIVKWLWPFSRVVMPFKTLHLKDTGWTAVLPAVGDCLQFGILWVMIGIAICAWRKRKGNGYRLMVVSEHTEN